MSDERAKIMPLKDGKYYGTEVQIDTGYGIEAIKIWILDDFTPSKRQLENWGMTLQEARDDLMMSDGHFESELCYQAALVLTNWLNSETPADAWSYGDAELATGTIAEQGNE